MVENKYKHAPTIMLSRNGDEAGEIRNLQSYRWRDVQVGAFALSGRMVVIPTLAHAVAKKLMKIRCKSFEGKTHKEVAFRK